MTPALTEQAREIAGKLTKAQRALLADETQHLPQHEAIMLANQGLSYSFIARGGRYYGLTPLGLAVRAILQERADAQADQRTETRIRTGAVAGRPVDA